MKTFHITRPDESIRPALIDKINNLTKPKGSLGFYCTDHEKEEYIE